MKLSKGLLCLSLLVLLSACNNDEAERGDNGNGNAPADRREIVIELQNGLRPATAGATRASIAEPDENHIRSLDLYVFACPQEEGQYTLSDRFCYRADDGALPDGAQKLDFKNDESTGQARVVFYPRKGMYCHFYCVANGTTLLHRDGTPQTDFKPLTLSNTPGEDGTGLTLTAAGSPTEEEFLQLLPPSLKEDDVLRAPLIMSGATILPIDLRSPSPGSSIRLNMRLTRAVARFDVVNNTLESHLVISSIALDRGRTGISLFPIAPLDGAEGEDSGLMTYADAPFDRPTANLGTATKAFYCYPSPAADDAALIIKGTYALNQTDAPVEVSYRIPFEQTVEGTGARIDIAHNHRYTLQITRADQFKLDHVIKIEDWADEGSLDHNLDNDLDELKVSNLTPDGKTTYNPLTETVTMSIDPAKGESSFTVHCASNTGVLAALNFVLASQSQHWLKMEEMTPDDDYQHKGSAAAKFKITVLPDRLNEGCPRAVLRLTDGSGKFEKILIIMPEPIPFPIPTTPLPDSPGEKLNLYDSADKTLHLYRVKGSTVQLKLSCPDGTTATADALNSWLKVERTGGTEQLSVFTLTMTNPDVVLTDDRAILTFVNKDQPDLKQDVILVLHEAEVTNLAISDHSGLSALDADKKEVVMTVTLDSKFRFSAQAYDAVKVEKIEYANGIYGKVDEWLEVTEEAANATSNAAPLDNQLAQTLKERMQLGWGKPGTRTATTAATTAGSVMPPTTRSVTLPVKMQNNLVFKMKSTAQYFGTATVMLKNTCLGPDLVLKVLPGYPVPVVSASTPMTPAPNNYDDANKTLYMLQQADGKKSVGTLSIYAPGGSTLVLPADITGLTLDRTTGELPTEKYALSWTGTNSTLTDHDVILQVKNASTPGQVQNITVKALGTDISDLTLTPKEANSATLDPATKEITVNMKEGNSFTLNMKSYGGQVTVKSCPAFLALPPTSRSMPQKAETTLTFTLKSDNSVNGKTPENIVLKNPCGGPELTLKVTPVYIAPVVSAAGTMTPANVNKWDATDNTLYLVQQSAGKTSSGILTVYSLGGSVIVPPDGITANLLGSDEKSQQYELRWAGSNNTGLTPQDLTLKLKNKSDDTKTTDVKLQLLPNIISDLALAPKAAGTADMSGTNINVNIIADNWFKLTMKAYGNATRVQVKSRPEWLKVSAPTATRTAPVKEQTVIIFTVDGTKTDFTQGNIVLTNPSGGPDLTLTVKPRYMTPTYNTAPALGLCNSSTSGWLNLIQPRSGSSTGTLRIYSLGGSRAELISATDGLTVSSNTLTPATLHDYPLQWTPANPNNARSDRDIKLRIYNHDNSLYLDQTIKLVANGSLDIYNTKYGTDKWDVTAVRSGAAALSAGLNINIVANATFEIHTNSYGGMTCVGNPAWVTPNRYQQTPADNTGRYNTKTNSHFRFTIKSQNGSYPAGNITLRPNQGGPDFVVKINPVYLAPTITAGNMNPSGVNNYDAGQSAVYLVQRAAGNSSTAQLSVYAPGGSKLTFPAYSGFSASPTSSTNATQIYTLAWAGSNSVQAAKDIVLTFANNSDGNQKKAVTAKLLPNTLRNVKLTAQTGGVSLNPGTLPSGTSATLTVPIIKGVGFTVSMECYGGTPGVTTKPGWLQSGAVTRAAPNSVTHTYHFDLIENAANFNDTQIVFTNPSGGPTLTLNITRVFQAPIVTDGGSPAPSRNSMSGNTLNLARTKTGTETSRRIQVYSLGGSKVVNNNGGNWFMATSVGTVGYHTVYYKVGHNNTQTNDNYGSAYSGSFEVQNAMDTGKKTTMTLILTSSRPRGASEVSGYTNSFRFNQGSSELDKNTWGYLDVMDDPTLYGTTTANFRVYSECGFNAPSSMGILEFKKTKSWATNSRYDEFQLHIPGIEYLGTGGTNGSFGTLTLTPTNESNYYLPYQFKMYNYLPIAKGYFAYKVGGKFFGKAVLGNQSLGTAKAVANAAGHGWRIPTLEDYRTTIFPNLTSSYSDRNYRNSAPPVTYFFNLFPADTGTDYYLWMEGGRSADYLGGDNSKITYRWGGVSGVADSYNDSGRSYILICDPN